MLYHIANIIIIFVPCAFLVSKMSLTPAIEDSGPITLASIGRANTSNMCRPLATIASSTLRAKCSIGKKEAPECLWVCEKCSVYLLGSNFKLCTDHKAPVTQLSVKGTGKRLYRTTRW